MPNTSPRFSNLFAISLLALAGSISYFTYQLSLIVVQIPDILENVRLTSEKIEPVLDEVEKIRTLIDPIMLEVNTINSHIPAILQESEQLRLSIPPILKESEQIRSSLPPILNESAQLRQHLPNILSSVNDTAKSVTLISKELNAYQPIATDALVQLEETRKEIPLLLDRTNAMIDRARVAAREASSGAVTGALGGLLTAPFRLVGSWGSNMLNLKQSEIENFTQEDLQSLQKITQELLDNGQPGDSRELRNSETKLHAIVSIEKEANNNDKVCRAISFKVWVDSKLELDKGNVACKNTDGIWVDDNDD